MIDQKKADGSFDEHKAFLGFNSREDALDYYHRSFSDGKAAERILGVTELSRPDFKEWVAKGDFKKPLYRAAKDAVRDAATKTGEEEAKKIEAADWQKHQGDPAKFVEQLTTAAGEVGTVRSQTKAAKLTGAKYIESQIRKAQNLKDHGDQEGCNKILRALKDVHADDEIVRSISGLGQKRSAFYEDVSQLQPDKAKQVVYTDSKASDKTTAGRKMAVMQSPDGSHVVVGAATMTMKNGERVGKVSFYDAGLGQKRSPAGHYPTDFDALVNAGWKPLASLKSDKPLPGGHFASYSLEQWKSIEASLRQIKADAGGKTEAMMATFEQAKDWGRNDAAHPSNDAPSGDAEVENNTRTLGDEATGEEVKVAEGSTHDIEIPQFDIGHAETIWDALAEHEPENPKEVLAALVQERAFGAIEPLVKDLGLDPKKLTPQQVADAITQFIFEHYEQSNGKNSGERSEAFAKSILSESRGQVLDRGQGKRPVSEPVRSADAGSGAAAAGDKSGASRAEEGANANGEGGAKPATAAAKPAKPAAADASGVVLKERNSRHRPEAMGESPKLIYREEYEDDPRTTPTGIGTKEALESLVIGRGDDGGTSARAASEKLQEFAAEHGYNLDPEIFQHTVTARKELAGGSEHTVYFDKASGRVIKLTHPDMVGSGAVGQSGDVNTYLRSLYLQNRIFGGDTRFEGLVKLDGEHPQLVTSQPFVNGRKATPAEIKAFFEKNGWKSEGGSWKKDGYTVADAVPDNVMMTKNGVVPFDVQVEYKGDLSVSNERFQTPQEEIKNLRPTDNKTKEVASSVENAMRAVGIRVDRVVDVLAKHFSSGQYKEVLNGRGNVERIITWAVADTHEPTSGNLVSLIHEVFHAMFARETPERQAMAQRAIKEMSDEMLGIGDFKEHVAAGVPEAERAGVEQEGRLAQSLAIKLVNEGFNPEEAHGLVQQAGRLIKDIYNGALMAIAKVAGYPVSQERALKYYENRLKMTLAGDSVSWVNFLGGPRLKMTDWDKPQPERYSGINPVTNPRKYLETREGAPVGIAALNHLKSAVLEQVHNWDLMGNLAGLSDEQVVRQFIHLPAEVGGSEMFPAGVGPSQLIAEAAKLHGISPETKFSDLPNEIAKQRAAAVAHRMFSEWKATMAGKLQEARHDWKSDSHALERNNNQLVRLAKDYVDIDHMAATAKKAMLDLVDDLGRSVSGIRDFAGRDGVLEQTMKQVEKLSDIPPPYRRAINEMADFLKTGNDDGKFSDSLQHIADMDIDWKNAKPGDIADGLRQHFLATKDPLLAGLFHDTPRAKALLSTVIAFGKSNSHMMDMLALRSEKVGEDRAKANQLLKDLMTASKSTMAALTERIQLTFGKNGRLRDRMLRIADKVASLKDRNGELTDAITRNKAFVDFYDKAFNPSASARMAELERTAGISLHNFEVAHNAIVPVPNGEGKIEGKTLKLRSDIGKRGERPTPTTEQVSWMQSMRDYLDQPENRKSGAQYNDVADAYDKLVNHFVSDDHINRQGSFLTRLIGPIQEKCQQTGTPIGRLLGQSFNRYSSLLRAKVREVVQTGTTFTAHLNDARAAAGGAQVCGCLEYSLREAP